MDEDEVSGSALGSFYNIVARSPSDSQQGYIGQMLQQWSQAQDDPIDFGSGRSYRSLVEPLHDAFGPAALSLSGEQLDDIYWNYLDADAEIPRDVIQGVRRGFRSTLDAWRQANDEDQQDTFNDQGALQSNFLAADDGEDIDPEANPGRSKSRYPGVPSNEELSSRENWRDALEYRPGFPQIGEPIDGPGSPTLTSAMYKGSRRSDIIDSIESAQPQDPAQATFSLPNVGGIRKGSQGGAQFRDAGGRWSLSAAGLDMEKIGEKLRDLLIENYKRLPINKDQSGTLLHAIEQATITPDTTSKTFSVIVKIADLERPMRVTEKRPVSTAYYGPRVFFGRPGFFTPAGDYPMRFQLGDNWLTTYSFRASRTDLNIFELSTDQTNSLILAAMEQLRDGVKVATA